MNINSGYMEYAVNLYEIYVFIEVSAPLYYIN